MKALEKILTLFIMVNILSLFAMGTSKISTSGSSLAPNKTNDFSTSDDEYFRDDYTLNLLENVTLLTHNMEMKVHLDNSIKITSTFVLTNNDTNPLEFFIYYINKNITSVFSYDPLGSLTFSWEINPQIGNILNITLRNPVIQDAIYVFSISYQIENVIYKIDEPVEYFGLDYEINHTKKSEQFTLEVTLPVYSQLLEEVVPSPVFPTPNRITIEDNVVKIYWEIAERDVGETDVFIVRYQITETITEPNALRFLPLYIILSFLGGILLSSITFVLIYKYKFKPVESTLVSSLLSNTEQEVIKAINADGGVSTQRRICDKTGYSKSKVSIILAKLEEKDVLKRERWGRTNKVTITNPSFKQIEQEKTEIK